MTIGLKMRSYSRILSRMSAPILTLPVEISQQAIILLAPNDISALAQTCKTFQTIIYADKGTQHVWASVFLGIWDDPRIRIFFEQRGGWFSGTPAQLRAALVDIEYDWRGELQRRMRAQNLISSRVRALRALCSERKAALSGLLSVVHSTLPFRSDDSTKSRNMDWVRGVLDSAKAMNHTMWPSLRHAIFRSNAQYPDAEEYSLRSELHTLVGLTQADRNTVCGPSTSEAEKDDDSYPTECTDTTSSMTTFINHSLQQNGSSLDEGWPMHEESLYHPIPAAHRVFHSHASEHTSSPLSPTSCSKIKGQPLNLRTAARAYVYDLRMYSESNLWGPVLRDPSYKSDADANESDKYKYIARWRHLECLMMVITFNIEEERLTMAGGALAFLLSTPSPPMTHDSLRPWSAPGFARRFAEAVERERSSEIGELKSVVKEGPTEANAIPELNADGWPDWDDWAGVEGKWKRIICFMDYRDLARFNGLNIQFAQFNPTVNSRDTSIFEEDDFHEAVRCLNIDIRISHIDSNPPSYCKTRPKIFFMGHSEYLTGEDPARQMRGTVECMPSGAIKWNLVSIWDGEERWTSQGIQIGGVGSARGVIGSWSGFEHNAGDPVGNTVSAPRPILASANDIISAEPLSYESGTDVKRGRSTRRKKTLLALLDELQALRDDEDIDLAEEGPPANPAPSVVQVQERIRNHPIAVDDRLRNEGADMFLHFHKRIRQVDTELLNFGNAVRPLGSSVGLISSAYNLRTRLQQILHLFRENASEIFPEKIKKQPADLILPLSSRKKSRSRRTARHRPTQTLRPTVGKGLTSDLEDFPEQFQFLAKDLVSFLHFLHDIPEFTDEGLNASVLSFEADLKYWASCMQDFKNQFQYPSIKRYVNDLTKEMDEHLKDIQDALKTFAKDGVSTIQTAQARTQSGLHNLSTVATFFSGVTASTLQFTVSSTPDNSLGHLVNCLWISSLVFSIASAINSQLAYHWRAAMYAVPWWVSIWLTRTPLAFLVVAVMAFSIGLVCFTHSSGQGKLVIISATIFTCLTSMALLAVALWFAFERWVFSKTKGSKWLWDVINDTRADFLDATGLSWVGRTTKRFGGRWGTQLVRAKTQVYEMSGKVADKLSSTVLGKPESFASESSDGDLESLAGRDSDSGLPTVNPSSSRSLGGHGRKFSESSIVSNRSRLVVATPTTPTIFQGQELVSSPTQENGPMSILSASSPQSPPSDNHVTLESPSASPVALPSPARAKFQRMVRQVVRSRALINKPTLGNIFPGPQPLRRQTTGVSVPETTGSHGPHHASTSDGRERLAVRPPRITVLIPALRQLRASQYLDWHQGLVRHLQFSMDGKWLATCSWDRTAVIWRVGDPFTLHKVLGHGSFGFVGQVAWSPTGTYLLTKLLRGVKIWTVETGVCKKTIKREQDVQAVAWLPGGTSFACVELGHVHIMNLEGEIIHSHHFKRMEIHDVAFTPDEKRMLLVGTLQESIHELKPSKSRAEKRIVVYDLNDNTIENQVPVLERVRDITISSDGQHALVSYEDTAPPELWRMAMIRKQIEGTEELEARLTLDHTYIPAETVHFAGPSYFGGASDQLVICAGKKGDIHIWDRESGLLLHTLQAANLTPGDDGGDLTGVAWNHKSPGQFMFASATHDGAVRIWTAPLQSDTQPPSRAESPNPTTRMRRELTTQPLSAPAL
ncbi:hypothetical protein FRB97_003279 [Tulasnella sp. 331]|nr:hypothetical protein FRB97_003279 [Tulasnella sp. 331]